MPGSELLGPIRILKTGYLLNLSPLYIARAIIIYHKFYERKTSEVDEISLAAACLSLSSKTDMKSSTTSQRTLTEMLLYEFHKVLWTERERHDKKMVLMPSFESKEFEEMLVKFSKIENYIAATLEYELDYKVAFQFVSPFIKKLQEHDNFDSKSLGERLEKIIMDFYCSPMSLKYEAYEIAYGSLDIILKREDSSNKYDITMKELAMISPEKIKRIENDILQLTLAE